MGTVVPEVAARRARAPSRWLKGAAGVAALGLAIVYLIDLSKAAEPWQELSVVLRSFARSPLALIVALAAYAAAFWLRACAWRRVLPTLPLGHAWAALHVALLGNHVLPFRLGEALRPASVLRRTDLPLGPVLASTVGLRVADLLAILLLAAAAAPALFLAAAGGLAVPLLALVLAVTLAGVLVWTRRQRDQLRLPDPVVAVSAVAAWGLETVVVWQVARTAGLSLSPYDAVGVTAVTILAQVLAVTPGGVGTYEAAATGALVALGFDPGRALAVALATHALKTAYALVVGGVALFLPGPSFWGRLRIAPERSPRPPELATPDGAPIVVVIPAHDEEATVGDVVRRVPRTCHGRHVVVLVIDDGSTDGSADAAAAAGARVFPQPANLGLGAAVRRALVEASALAPAAVVYLDADGEYFPEDIASVVAPVLAGDADYVVGSRFAGEIRRMQVRRRVGNLVLTRWLRWVARERLITDGQSGFRAFSPAAAADAVIVHDYNYAQVLTLDLLAKGYRLAEVPITYAFRESGTSFIRLGRYLRRVLPAVHHQVNSSTPAQSSTTWLANRSRAAAHSASSNEPPVPTAATAS